MKFNIETELKFRFTEAGVWDRIAQDPLLQKLAEPGSLKVERIETTYYDTRLSALRKRKIAYRIRWQGGKWIATVKAEGTSAGCLHERKEWSIPVKGPQPDLAVFRNTPLGDVMRETVGPDKLVAFFRTSFQRKSMILKMPGGGEIEFCADKGGIFAGRRMKPLQEIELELRGAKPAEALELGGMLARRYSLVPESRSKYAQGLTLAGVEDDIS